MDLKAARTKIGMKRSEMARTLGVSYSHIQKIERIVHGTSPELARKLEALLAPHTNRIEVMWPRDYPKLLETAARLLECPPEDLHTILSAAGRAANEPAETDTRQPGP